GLPARVPADERPGLAERVRRAREHERDATPPLSADAENATFLGIECNETPWAGDRATLLAESQRLGLAYPLLGWSTLRHPCVFCHHPTVSLPRPTGAGVPPVLMVQSVRDPATPI